MNSPTLSIVLATRNEEANISHCLKSVSSVASEIIVVDESSSDRTVDIAKYYGAKVFNVPHQENFHITKNMAIDKAKGEWILQLDADEVVSEQLSKEIVQVIKSNPKENGFWINRKNWFLSRFLTKGGQYPDPTLRLYKKGLGRLPAKDVHEQAVVEGPTGHLKHDLLHFRDTSLNKYLQGFNRYSSIQASQFIKSGKNPILNLPKFIIVKPLYTFLLIYFRHKGFVDGVPGLIFALFSGLIYPSVIVKVLYRKLFL